MKDLENHHIGRSEPNKWNECGNNENADICSMFGCMGTLIMIAVLAISAFCTSSCSRTIIEERPVYMHDTMDVQQLRVDSIMHRDSIYIHEWTQGDTIFVERLEFRERYHDRLKNDTIYKVREVPVTITKTETKEVEKPLKRWQKFFIAAGLAAAVAAIIKFAHYLFTHTRAKEFLSKIIKNT